MMFKLFKERIRRQMEQQMAEKMFTLIEGFSEKLNSTLDYSKWKKVPSNYTEMLVHHHHSHHGHYVPHSVLHGTAALSHH
jgi:hypothetical protein